MPTKNTYDEPGFGSALRAGLALIVFFGLLLLAMRVVGFGFWAVTKPMDVVQGTVDRVLNPDAALASYRWFHDASNQIEAKKGQIRLSKGALAASSEDRKEARRVELLGAQQSCMTLVASYNSRAERADTVIFLHPERFLPGDWPGERKPLPNSFSLEACE